MHPMQKLSSIQLLSAGFAVIILAGALMLCLPVCTVSGESTPFIDSLFTSASATCVTGLSPMDIYTHWNFLGQLIILLLIQIGGLGFMGLSMAFLYFSGHKISIFQRTTLMESMGSLTIGTVTKVLRTMALGTLFFEGAGAALLAFRFIPLFGTVQGMWFSIFHAVSAFCNAGFDLMGIFTPGTSLQHFAKDPLVLLTTIILIITGGIGFIVWSDFVDHRFRFRTYTLHSKIMLTVTAALIISGCLLFFFLESDTTLRSLSTAEKWLDALFLSVSPRTAGFAISDYNDFSPAGRVLTMCFMIIGAGPGSTGGGIKVTTFTVVLLSIASQIFRSKDLSLFQRRLPEEVQHRAFNSISFYLIASIFCTFLLLLANPRLLSEHVLFEVLSALGTVGLSMGITAELNVFAKAVLIALMYLGRLGSIAVIMVISSHSTAHRLRYPKEPILIG